MSIGQGIKLASGFDLNSKIPLDGRTKFETLAERNALPDINLFEGLMCFVNEDKKNYQYINGAWQEFKSGGVDIDLSTYQTKTDNTLNTTSKQVVGSINEVNNKKFDGVIATKNGNITTLKFKGNGIDLNSVDVEGGNSYWIGSTPPTDTNLIWIDTSDGSIDSIFTSVILDELRSTINGLQNRIITLEADVEYLKINGGGGGGANTQDFTLLTESGDYIITENGDYIVFEDYSGSIETYNILIEDGNTLITEDGNNLTIE